MTSSQSIRGNKIEGNKIGGSENGVVKNGGGKNGVVKMTGAFFRLKDIKEEGSKNG